MTPGKCGSERVRATSRGAGLGLTLCRSQPRVRIGESRVGRAPIQGCRALKHVNPERAQTDPLPAIDGSPYAPGHAEQLEASLDRGGCIQDVVHRSPRVVIVIVLASLLSCAAGSVPTPSGSPSRSVVTPTTGGSPTPTRLAGAPSGCPTGGPLLQNVPPWGDLFGASPAFSAFYARTASSDSFHLGGNTRWQNGGWAIKVLWVLEPGTNKPVTISGRDETGAPIVFDPLNGPPSDTLRLDPSHPGTSSRRAGWTEYPSLLSFPEVGCYVIQASWADGSWQRGFGLGK